MAEFPSIWKKNKNLFFPGDRELSVLRLALCDGRNLMEWLLEAVTVCTVMLRSLQEEP